MVSVTSIHKRLDDLAARFAEAKSKLTQHSPVSEEDSLAIADFESRTQALRAQLGDEGEIELSSLPPEHQSLAQELHDWLSDIDRRFNNPAKRNQSVSM